MWAGAAEPVDLTARDRAIGETIGPELKARGLIFAGIDVIGDYLTEITRHLADGNSGVEKRSAGSMPAPLIRDAIETSG